MLLIPAAGVALAGVGSHATIWGQGRWPRGLPIPPRGAEAAPGSEIGSTACRGLRMKVHKEPCKKATLQPYNVEDCGPWAPGCGEEGNERHIC